MNDNRNERINQITEDTLVIGIDIAKQTHYACPVDDRGRELTRKAIPFNQSRDGFESFQRQVEEWLDRYDKKHVLIGFEPTGHYWMNLGFFLLEVDLPFVQVHPMHVKKSQEFDDNLQTKNDSKDARLIAKLMVTGSFFYPRIPEGFQAELRNGFAMRWRLKKDIARLKNQMIQWLDQYFPEFKSVFKDFHKLACVTLKFTPLPEDLLRHDVEELARIYKEEGGLLRVAKKTIHEAQDVARQSIGLTEGLEIARLDMKSLVTQFLLGERQLEEVNQHMEELAKQFDEFEYLVSIPGISAHTVLDLLAETGSLTQYKNPRQLIKLAGLTLREHSSGQYKGQKTISKRGRKRLRSLLFKAILPLLRNNEAFHELYQYYITRPVNPLKKKEAMVVLCGKLLKILHGLSKHENYFHEERMKQDLHCLKQAA
ncbi:IS110 family transposase [Halobacillus trueperi]|uniref:IS110 family transposase n=1 Tax=Halobacillus trueperi TaxID=156205 RepID=A0A3E0J0G4_9BACI|nr:IS110 family transposase [Halobacillus trueperi]REJ06347.1 IS110 family transposase [Halobacillus trueperi]